MENIRKSVCSLEWRIKYFIRWQWKIIFYIVAKKSTITRCLAWFEGDLFPYLFPTVGAHYKWEHFRNSSAKNEMHNTTTQTHILRMELVDPVFLLLLLSNMVQKYWKEQMLLVSVQMSLKLDIKKNTSRRVQTLN